MPERSAEEIRRDLEAERARLTASVEDLRAAIAEATDVKGKLAAKLPVVAAGALGAGFGFGRHLLCANSGDATRRNPSESQSVRARMALSSLSTSVRDRESAARRIGTHEATM